MFPTWMGIPLCGLHTLISQPTKALGKAAHGVCARDSVITKLGVPFQLVRHSGSPRKLLFLMSIPVIVTLCSSLVQSTRATAGLGARSAASFATGLATGLATGFGAGLAASVATNAVPGRNPASAVAVAAISMAV